MKKLKPLGHRAVVMRHETETKVGSMGLILAPETRIDKSLRCTVLAVGKGYWKKDHWVPIEVKPGDVVIVRQWSGDAVPGFDDPNMLIVFEDVIEAVDATAKPDPKAISVIDRWSSDVCA